MASDLVAWSPIRSAKNNGTDKDPDMEAITVKPGESVSKSSLGLDDDQFAQLVESGAVRTMPFPEMPETYQGSPVEFMREQAANAAAGVNMDAEASAENMAAILAANDAATGGAMLATDPAFDPKVADEMDKQKEANSPGSSTVDVTPPKDGK